MVRTFATLFGVVYAVMGVLGLIGTGLVGVNGVFAADLASSIVLIVAGIALLYGASRTQSAARGMNLAVGMLLILAAIIGFIAVPVRGEVFGLLVNSAGHWANLLVGIVLAGTALLERSGTYDTRRTTMRHAMQ